MTDHVADDGAPVDTYEDIMGAFGQALGADNSVDSQVVGLKDLWA